jgi:type IV pilus assembly protein PilP
MKTILAFGLAAIALAGCGGGEHEELKQWMKESTKDMKGKVPPLPEIRPFPVIAYDALDLVDPFNPKRIEPDKKSGGGKRPDENRRKEPLEAYPLESLKMVGALTQAGAVHAIVQADRTYHQIRAGNYLGQNFGVVTKVSEAEIALKELVQDAAGDWIERMSTLQLQEKQEARK